MLLIWKSDKQYLRAYFFKARKVSQLPGIRTLANTAIVDYIRKVFDVESEVKALRAQYEQRGEAADVDRIVAAANKVRTCR